MTFDPAPEKAPESRGEKLVYAGLALFVVVAFAAEIATDFHPAKLSILFMLLCWAPLLVVHELGHAVVAAWLGWRVEGVVIGFGPKILDRAFRGVPVSIHALPVEGFVRCRPRTLTSVRTRSAAVYFAGPGVELLIAGGLWLALGPALVTPSTDVATIAVQSLALAAALGGVINLIPHSRVTDDGELPSDGLGLFLSFTLPIEHFRQMVGSVADEPLAERER